MASPRRGGGGRTRARRGPGRPRLRGRQEHVCAQARRQRVLPGGGVPGAAAGEAGGGGGKRGSPPGRAGAAARSRPPRGAPDRLAGRARAPSARLEPRAEDRPRRPPANQPSGRRRRHPVPAGSRDRRRPEAAWPGSVQTEPPDGEGREPVGGAGGRLGPLPAADPGGSRRRLRPGAGPPSASPARSSSVAGKVPRWRRARARPLACAVSGRGRLAGWLAAAAVASPWLA